MDLAAYNLEASEDFLKFIFYSTGPKGTIRKIIRFTEYPTIMQNIYNLGFGDWNNEEQRMDDSIISNNRDTERIFATVAAAIMEFSKHYPGASIYAEGSTPARTRLYQMKINKYLNEIEAEFEVFGTVENEQLIPFSPEIKYLSFIAMPKSL